MKLFVTYPEYYSVTAIGTPSVGSFKRNLKHFILLQPFNFLTSYFPFATSDCPRLRFGQLTDIVRVTNFCIVLFA